MVNREIVTNTKGRNPGFWSPEEDIIAPICRELCGDTIHRPWVVPDNKGDNKNDRAQQGNGFPKSSSKK